MKDNILKRLSHLGLLAMLIFVTGEIALAEDGPNKDLGWPGLNLEGFPCTGGGQGYGPYDYTNPQHFKQKLPIVTRAHFTKKVERLIEGESTYLVGDLDYTLRAFPNHHRALHAIMRYATQPGWEDQPKLLAKPECYFQRAIVFQPEDGMARLLFGTFLHRRKNYDLAMREYQAALKKMPENLSLHYNMGLLYAELKQYDKAKEHARICYSKGYRLTGLKRKLAQAGYNLD